APFAAETHGLQEPEDDEQDRRQYSDLLIGRQQADEERAETHQQHREHKHRLAAHPVAEMAEHDAAEGPGNVSEGIDTQRRERADDRIRGWKEQRPEHERSRARVYEEVVPLDHCPNGARRHDFAGRGPLTRLNSLMLAGIQVEWGRTFSDA